MERQVLSIEQMQELIDMGIDTSNASMCWWEHNNWTELKAYSFDQITCNGKIKEIQSHLTPTFTLQDILEMLPKRISVTSEHTDKSEYWGFNALRIGYPSLSEDLYIEYTQDPYMNSAWACFNAERSILDAAFNMLVWCKESGHV